MDPAHAPFVHHGVVAKMEDYRPLHAKMTWASDDPTKVRGNLGVGLRRRTASVLVAASRSLPFPDMNPEVASCVLVKPSKGLKSIIRLCELVSRKNPPPLKYKFSGPS